MKSFEAYYSRLYSCVLLISCCAVALMASFMYAYLPDAENEKWHSIAVCTALAIFLLFMFIVNVRKSGIAVEICDQKLILHKKNKVEIPLNTITWVRLRRSMGSFDLYVKTADARYSMHCFIKQDLEKKYKLINILEGRGIKVYAFSTRHM